MALSDNPKGFGNLIKFIHGNTKINQEGGIEFKSESCPSGIMPTAESLSREKQKILDEEQEYKNKGWIKTEEINEYGEGYPVEIKEKDGRTVIVALNEGGYNSTIVDLEDLLTYLQKHKPELLKINPE